MTVKNAKTLPKVYFGLHMVEGVAEYREPGLNPYRIMIAETAIKNMDSTFQGRPVYVKHVDEVDLSNIQAEADGYVVRSFFNASDGKHWAEFIIVSDRGHEAIRSGWKLSNAYIPKSFTGGGLWHGVEYSKEVTSGEYEHLAIVPNPRYEESVILTPDEFKEYNGEKQLELTRLANSKDEKGEKKMKFWKKQKLENSIELESTVVTLPKSGKEKTIAQLVNDMDDMEMNAMANPEHHVMVGEEKMKVNELVQKHMECMNELAEMKKKSEGDEDAKDDAKMNDEQDKLEAKEAAESEGDDKALKEAKKNEEEKAKEEKPAKEVPEAKKANAADKKKHFDSLKNAPNEILEEIAHVDLSEDKVLRGKSRYGSAQ